MSTGVVVLGAQWGDEGKGKIVDYLGVDADVVIRAQGGNNAGHTLWLGNRRLVLHVIPSGILRPHCQCVIGQGVVLDPVALVHELSTLTDISWEGRLWVSHAASLVLATHRALDQAREQLRGLGGVQKIGTTGRGMGPAYEDKAARRGLRIFEWMDPDRFVVRARDLMTYHNFLLTTYYHVDPIDIEAEIAQLSALRAQIRPLLMDVPAQLRAWRTEGKRMVLEGAQGALLDVDHGTYPFVTSSSTVVGGLLAGAGLGPSAIHRVLGVLKAYCTRVGEGPFPTEDQGADGERLCDIGREYGSTTGRKRRCGWFDAVAARRACWINGIQALAVTKLDVLDTFDQIQIATHYAYQGQIRQDFPSDPQVLAECVPMYQSFPGWRSSTRGIRAWKDLPIQAQAFLEALSTETGCALALVSTGPEREETLACYDIWSGI